MAFFALTTDNKNKHKETLEEEEEEIQFFNVSMLALNFDKDN